MLAIATLVAIAIVAKWTVTPPKGPSGVEVVHTTRNPQIMPRVIRVNDREALRLDARYRAAKRVGGQNPCQ